MFTCCRYDTALEPWQAGLWPALSALHPLPSNVTLDLQALLPPVLSGKWPLLYLSECGVLCVVLCVLCVCVVCVCVCVCVLCCVVCVCVCESVFWKTFIELACHYNSFPPWAVVRHASPPVDVAQTAGSVTAAAVAAGTGTGTDTDSDTASASGSLRADGPAPIPWTAWTWGHGQGPASPCPHMARVKCNHRLTAAHHDQDVRHIELDLQGSGISYEPGDVLVVYPDNPRAETLSFIASLGLTPDDILEITSTDTHLALPSPVRVLDLFSTYLDIFGTPRRYFFEVMVHFASQPMQQEKLRELSSAEGQDELYRYCLREKRSFVEVLRDFVGVVLPLEYLLELIPRISSRQFSISSSLRAHPEEAHICVAMVQYVTSMRRTRTGLCSAYLSAAKPNDHVRVWVSAGSFRMRDLQPPVILIGPGTGIAPFRAMVEERVLQRTRGENVGPTVLCTGNRYQSRDFLFGSQWQELLASGQLHCVLSAFSRDQSHKEYVQDKLDEKSGMLFELVHHHGAIIYVAGNAKNMPKDVRLAWARIVARGLPSLSAAEVDAYLRQLELTHRYMIECWN
jgi:sulfite reductase alpha subunit-like flavoprotein